MPNHKVSERFSKTGVLSRFLSCGYYPRSRSVIAVFKGRVNLILGHFGGLGHPANPLAPQNRQKVAA